MRSNPESAPRAPFLRHPEQAWLVIREIFYDNFGRARPHRAHEALAAWEARDEDNLWFQTVLPILMLPPLDIFD
jgi:NAD-dependent SIR2 family protein deacetylase